jgi:hypothetical protein
MSGFNGSGTYVRVHDFTADATAGIAIRADRMDAEFDAITTALSTCLTKDGQTTPTGAIPMGSQKITGLGTPTADTDAATKLYVDESYAGGWVTAAQYDAPTDNTTDATTALQNALDTTSNVYLGPGIYYITDALATTSTYQRIVGAGPGETIISIKDDFNMSAVGAINLAHWYTSVENLTIRFDQSAATNRASLEGYPPAIYASGKAQLRLRRLEILRAETGVYCTGNTGGSIFQDVQVGAFTKGFHVVGAALDSMIFDSCRAWPYGIDGDATLEAIYEDGDNLGFDIGRVDDLKIKNALVFKCGFKLTTTSSAGSFGSIEGLALDGDLSVFTMDGGQIHVSNVYATRGGSADSKIMAITGTTTRLTVQGFDFTVAAEHTDSVVTVGSGASAIFCDGFYKASTDDNVLFDVTGGRVKIDNVNFIPGDSARTDPLIKQSSAADLQVTNCWSTILSTGSGTFVDCGTDRYNVIANNHTGGLGITKPAVAVNGLYGPNFVDKTEANYVRFDNRIKVGPHNDSLAGGAMVLEGADTNDDVTIDNLSGVARIVTAAGMGLQIIDGTDTLEIPFPEATATNIAAVGNAINTTGKFAGKYVWDTTNNRLVRARAGLAASPWDVVDGSAAVTPA